MGNQVDLEQQNKGDGGNVMSLGKKGKLSQHIHAWLVLLWHFIWGAAFDSSSYCHFCTVQTHL